ncbi:MAG TPA: sigma-70 family RNA polymerase sigma factor [Actinomycetota bacterium]|nr:sigma-70 family RNA polymerase sigma factor [Actinomycetota bacterium]
MMSSEGAVEALRRSSDEPEAFALFYDRHSEGILKYFTRRIFDVELAVDLTAETFAHAYLGRRRFRGTTDETAAAWLYRIADRQLTRYLRKGAAERRAMARLGIDVPHVGDEERRRIEELADLRPLRTALRVELTRLSPEQRRALQLRVLDELPYSEVASRLNITEQAARARVSRALRNLGSALRNPLPKEAR